MLKLNQGYSGEGDPCINIFGAERLNTWMLKLNQGYSGVVEGIVFSLPHESPKCALPLRQIYYQSIEMFQIILVWEGIP